ncbi:MAG: YbgC/FadM family acyl-CoA thioesterase [Elusimicrobiota bacterium]|jgi:acyl-CoA thioester hydrolase
MSGKKILIIDDDQALVAPLKDGLESLGYKVAVAYDGMQGLLQAHQSRPDIIILDFNMPGGGGDSVYERLRQNKFTERTPIVFSTVLSVDDVKGRIHPSANTYFLRKPATLAQLTAVVRSVLGEKESAASSDPFPSAPPASAIGHPKARSKAAAPAPSASGRVHEYAVRVTYADTDQMGVVYYGNYMRFFEQGRTELLRSLGVRYRDLERQNKLYLPVSEVACQYLSPGRYDDLLLVRTWVSELGKASICFAHEVRDAAAPARLLAEGRTRHPLVNGAWKPTRVPGDLRKLLEPFLNPDQV